MGPNGSGKSTLAMALMGHPKYEVTRGEVRFKGQNVLELEPEERAKLGLFLAFQYQALKARLGGDGDGNGQPKVDFREFRKRLKENLKLLRLDESFATRYLNEGFSGGEKKRCEILQMLMLQPEMAILDETDSGLDIEDFGCLAITHYQRILNYLKPDVVHVMVDGRIARSGGPELAQELEEKGYEPILRELGLEVPASESEGVEKGVA